MKKVAEEDSKKGLGGKKLLIPIGIFSVVLYGFALYGIYSAIWG